MIHEDALFFAFCFSDFSLERGRTSAKEMEKRRDWGKKRFSSHARGSQPFE